LTNTAATGITEAELANLEQKNLEDTGTIDSGKHILSYGVKENE